MHKKWSERFPEGRHIYYEGHEPEAFAIEMVEKFGFDPRESKDWGIQYSADKLGGAITMYGFFCPASVIDDVYGNKEYPLGS